MKYQSFWFRAISENNGTKNAFVFVTSNMEEAWEYAKNVAQRSGSALLSVEVISREQANETA